MAGGNVAGESLGSGHSNWGDVRVGKRVRGKGKGMRESLGSGHSNWGDVRVRKRVRGKGNFN